MSIATKSAETLLWLYKSANRAGLLEAKLVQSLYISSYFSYKKYLEDSLAKLTKHYPNIFKGGNILDIGANIGYTSFVFSKIIDPSFKILAFEPEEKNIKILKKVSQKYRFSNQLITVAAAVGDKEGEIDLWLNDANNADHRILTEELKKQLDKNIKIQKCPVVTVDNYLKKFGEHFPISFIKIDVQGYELAVFKGMSQTLTHNPNTVVSFEYCPSVIESLGFRPEDLLEFFQTRGYQFYFLNKRNNIVKYDVEKGDLSLRKMKPHDYIDLLCSRRDLTLGLNTQ